MTNQIEKEFFEVFKLPYIIRSYLFRFTSLGLSHQIYIKNQEIRAYKERYKDGKVILVLTKKNKITPEIILKLEEILFKKDFSITYSIKKDKYLYSLWKTISTLLGIEGKTRKDALLKLCTKLAPVIKEEVKAVFNASN